MAKPNFTDLVLPNRLEQKIPAIPAWVKVLAFSAVVGAVSAMVSVTGLARVRNSNAPAIEVPLEGAETVEQTDTGSVNNS